MLKYSRKIGATQQPFFGPTFSFFLPTTQRRNLPQQKKAQLVRRERVQCPCTKCASWDNAVILEKRLFFKFEKVWGVSTDSGYSSDEDAFFLHSGSLVTFQKWPILGQICHFWSLGAPEAGKSGSNGGSQWNTLGDYPRCNTCQKSAPNGM